MPRVLVPSGVFKRYATTAILVFAKEGKTDQDRFALVDAEQEGML